MANDLNRCEFIGRLGADPETRYTANGAAVCNFRIAAGWKSKEKEGTEWIPIVVWGKLAEACQKYLIKGSRVYVSGSWRTRKWQDSSGQDRYTTEVVLTRFRGELTLLDSRGEGGGQASDRGSDFGRSSPMESGGGSRGGGGNAPSYAEELDDEIPF